MKEISAPSINDSIRTLTSDTIISPKFGDNVVRITSTSDTKYSCVSIVRCLWARCNSMLGWLFLF